MSDRPSLESRRQLTGAGGLQSETAGEVTEWASRFFSLGPTLELPVLDHGYGSGVASFIEVLDAERTLRQNELLRAQVDTVVGEDLVSLYRALGGGWESTVAAAK